MYMNREPNQSTHSPSNTGVNPVEVIRQLTAELPLNDFGLPTGIYRTDLLPFHDYIPPHRSTASVPIGDDRASPSLLPDLGSNGADAFALLSGAGDGLPDHILPSTTQALPPSIPKPSGDYRIAGFLAKSLHTAFVPLQYDEGFPAFEDGRPFWARLDYEPTGAYHVFQRYMQMNFGRAADRTVDDDAGEAASGIRSITTLILQINPRVSDQQLLALAETYKQYYHLYYWGMRIKAYDLFKVTEYRQKQELRAIETQDDHYVESRRLRARLMQYMDSEDDFWDLMTPKVALDMLKTTTQLERISAGVPAAGPQTKEVEGGNRSFEMAFRTIAQEQAGDSGRGTDVDEAGNLLSDALDDPATTKILQEFIIRSNGGG